MQASVPETEDVVTVVSHLSKVHRLEAATSTQWQINSPWKSIICETTSKVVFVLNSSFTSKDQYFRAAIQEAMIAFNNNLQDFGYTQTLEYYDPNTH